MNNEDEGDDEDDDEDQHEVHVCEEVKEPQMEGLIRLFSGGEQRARLGKGEDLLFSVRRGFKEFCQVPSGAVFRSGCAAPPEVSV